MFRICFQSHNNSICFLWIKPGDAVIDMVHNSIAREFNAHIITAVSLFSVMFIITTDVL